MPARVQFNQHADPNDALHMGARQAGFKSMLTYRADIGIPGYTGYIPGCMGIPVPMKGSLHTGRVADEALHSELTAGAANSIANPTEYAARFQPDAATYQRPAKEGGGFWFAARKPAASLPFLSSTTYREEVNRAADTAARQLAATQGVACTLANYEVARRRRCASAPSVATSPSKGRTTRWGDLLGYKTTYGSMLPSNPITPLLRRSTGPADKEEDSDTVTSDQASQVQQAHSQSSSSSSSSHPACGAPALLGHTSYKQDFGDLGSDPMLRAAASEKEMTCTATTAPLADGTVRTTHHIPGYCGFVMTAVSNGAARAHSVGARPRPDAKASMLLFDLGQFGRSRLPHYTGFKPHAPSNVTSDQLANMPLPSTTKGATEKAMQLQAPLLATVNGKSHSHKAADGIVGFFQAGGEFLSENGLSDAQKYYTLLRPLEGRPKAAQPSQTTDYGRRFTGANARVT